ncbi:MAG: ATP-dependent helicase [Acidimicrobiia bacterium]|nr:ATP-dependent helicase [Acidimicrobiia bacterium]
MTTDHPDQATAPRPGDRFVFVPSPEQRAVIEHPLEPLRVTAGAGSGKTGTMAQRLAHFVIAGVVAPEEALGITFTNKAAGELADRLRRTLPDHTAEGREVEVTTYHGFAHSLIREFGPLVGAARDARIVTPGYSRQLIRDAIASTRGTHLDLTQPGKVVDRVAGLASALGDHLRAAADIQVDAEDPVAAERNDLAAVLAAYVERKRRFGVVDFADLVTLAHRLVTEHPGLAARIRDRYRMVLLDEYQDTNPGQRELLRSIFGDGFPVTAVGDTDQTIYEWRGASPYNFASFTDHFRRGDGRPAESKNLSVSWRNDAVIVAAANTVRSELLRPGPLPALQARPGADPGRITTHWAHSAAAEARWLADEVEAIHEGGTPWREIAVLFRKHRQMAMIRDALVDRGIPVEVASLGGLLEVPEVVELHAWLRILGRPDDAVALCRILTGSRYRLGLGDLAPLVRWVSARHAVGDDEDSGIGWAVLEAVDDLEGVTGLRAEIRHRLEEFRALYRSLLATAQGVSLVELCRVVLDRIDAWPEVDALEASARLSTRLNLHRFLDLAEEWSPLEGSPSLEAFLDHLDLLADEASSGELDTARVSGEDAVPLLTVHRAKGLEWDAVFLPALQEKVFPSSVLQYEDPVTVPAVLPYRFRLDRDVLPELPDDDAERREILRAAHDDQEWRTAYVAVTRCRRALYASGAFWTGGVRPRRPSRLFEILDGLGIAAPDRCEDPGEPPAPHASTRRVPAPDPVFPQGWRAAIAATAADPSFPERLAADAGLAAPYDRAVDQLRIALAGLPDPADAPIEPLPFTTSVTGLVTLAGCPQRFHWSEIDRLPRRPSAAARRGVELHRRIEMHNRGTVAFEDIAASGYDAVGDEPSPESAFERFSRSRFAATRPILVEAPFTLVLDGARVSGRIDAVYAAGSGWEVVDFKSGRASDDPARRVQLEAYALAVADAGLAGGRTPETIRVTFAYCGGGDIEELTESVDAEWLSAARRHLGTLLAAAAAPDHPPTPGDSCRHCDFAHLCPAGTAWLEAHR